MPCGTNQSDDQYREIAYALPTTSHYQRFHAKVLGGAGEADQLFGVTVFARGQYVRADQTVAIASANLRPGDSGSLGGKLSDGADTLVLRLVCHLPGASITIDGADLDP
jgi:hypothetical protein